MHLVPRLDLHDVFRRCSLGSLAWAKLPLSVADVVIRQCFGQKSTTPMDVEFRQYWWLSLASTKILSITLSRQRGFSGAASPHRLAVAKHGVRI
jgi:hypothetical protein